MARKKTIAKKREKEDKINRHEKRRVNACRYNDFSSNDEKSSKERKATEATELQAIEISNKSCLDLVSVSIKETRKRITELYNTKATISLIKVIYK